MSEIGIQTLVDELAEHLGRAVVVDDTDVHLISASRHFGDEDEQRIRTVLQREVGLGPRKHILNQGVSTWTKPGVIPGRADLGMQARLCTPIRHRGFLLGLILVIDADGSLTSEEVSMTEKAAGEISAHLYASHLRMSGVRVDREGAVQHLLSPDQAVRRRSLDHFRRSGWLSTTQRTVVTALQVLDTPVGAPVTGRDALRAAISGMKPSRTHGLWIDNDCAYLVHVADGPTLLNDARKLAQRIAAAVEELLGPGGRCVAGIGEVVNELEDAWSSRDQALIAARAAERVATFGSVAAWEDLGAYASILQLPPHALGANLLPRSIRQLMADSEPGWLVETLESFLDHGGSAPRTAAALHIHRTSLYYRLDRIRATTGLDLDDGENRLTLHLGVRMLRLLQSEPHRHRSPHSAEV